MDVHVRGVVRRFATIRPPGVGAPGSFHRGQQDFAGGGVAPGAFGRLDRDGLVDARGGEGVGDARDVRRVLDVHVGDLVVGERERARGVQIGIGHAADDPRGEEPRLAERDVGQRRRLVDGGDGVVADDEQFEAAFLGERRQAAELAAQQFERARAPVVRRAEALQVVVERGEVDEEDVRGDGGERGFGAGDDGVADFGGGQGAPVAVQGEPAALGEQQAGEFGRTRIRLHRHAAVVEVDRRGRDHVVRRLAEALLPEEHPHAPAGRACGFPDARAFDEGGRLLPEGCLAQAAVEEAVGDHSVLPRLGGGAEARLRGAGHGGEDGGRRRQVDAGDARQAAAGDLAPAEPRDIDDHPFGRHGDRIALRFSQVNFQCCGMRAGCGNIDALIQKQQEKKVTASHESS